MATMIDSRRSRDEATNARGELAGFLRPTLSRQMQEEEAFCSGDVETRLVMWSHEDPVTRFGAAGANRSG